MSDLTAKAASKYGRWIACDTLVGLLAATSIFGMLASLF